MDRGQPSGERREPEGEAFERSAEKGGVVSRPHRTPALLRGKMQGKGERGRGPGSEALGAGRAASGASRRSRASRAVKPQAQPQLPLASARGRSGKAELQV